MIFYESYIESIYKLVNYLIKYAFKSTMFISESRGYIPANEAVG